MLSIDSCDLLCSLDLDISACMSYNDYYLNLINSNSIHKTMNAIARSSLRINTRHDYSFTTKQREGPACTFQTSKLIFIS